MIIRLVSQNRTKETFKVRSLADKRFIAYYHKIMAEESKRAQYKRLILEKSEVMKIQHELWKTVREHYIENEGGVYISNLGYLCHIMRPKRKLFANHISNTIIRMQTNGYLFRHVCLDFSPKLQYFHLYKSIIKTVKHECNKRLKKGKRYKFLYNEVIAWISNKFRVRKLRRIDYGKESNKS